MFDRLKKILEMTDADYADIRYEEKTDTLVSFEGENLTGLSSGSADGYVLRVLKNGGFASVAFTSENDAAKAVKKAMQDAAVLAKSLSRPVELAPVKPVKDVYKPSLDEDPRKIPLEEKTALVRGYNAVALKNPKVVSTATFYSDVIREKHFMSTEGAAITEDLVTTQLRGAIIAAEGDKIRKASVGCGGSEGFATLRNREKLFEERTALAVDLLSAPKMQGGTCDVVLNPMLAAIFLHEAFGHFSEADIIEDMPSVRSRTEIGVHLGTEILTIVDDPTPRSQLGHYKYDDEGVLARPAVLMKNGILTGRLHSRRTAARFGEPVTGHTIAEDYRYAPIIRMGSIYIENGPDTLEGLMDRLDDGYYCADSLGGGETAGENYTFTSGYGYRIKNGKKRELVQGASISGNLYSTLKNIVGIADDLVFLETGGCGKGQVNPRSCMGSPHIMIHDVVVGGA